MNEDGICRDGETQKCIATSKKGVRVKREIEGGGDRKVRSLIILDYVRRSYYRRWASVAFGERMKHKMIWELR